MTLADGGEGRGAGEGFLRVRTHLGRGRARLLLPLLQLRFRPVSQPGGLMAFVDFWVNYLLGFIPRCAYSAFPSLVLLVCRVGIAPMVPRLGCKAGFMASAVASWVKNA